MKLPHGFGSIHLVEKGAKKKRNRPYRARVLLGYTPDGKRIYRNVGYFKTKAEAHEALVAYHSNPFVFNEKLTIEDIYERLMETSFTNLSDKRIKTYISIFNVHVAPIHKLDIKDVKVSQIEMLITNKTKSIQKEILNLMKKIFEWAIKNEHVTKNYAELVNPGDVAQAETSKQESKPFTDEEILEVWKMFREGNKYAAPILLMLYTGIRIGEIETLVKYDGYFIGGSKTNAGLNRFIPIHPELEEVLPFVNYNVNDSTLYKFIKATFNHKAHDTRHTFVTNMRKNGADDPLLKAIIGHQSNDVTDIYTHLDDEDKLTEIKKLNLPKC